MCHFSKGQFKIVLFPLQLAKAVLFSFVSTVTYAFNTNHNYFMYCLHYICCILKERNIRVTFYIEYSEKDILDSIHCTKVLPEPEPTQR